MARIKWVVELSFNVAMLYSTSYALYIVQLGIVNQAKLKLLLRKLELEKNKAEAEVALLSTQLSFSNVAQLTEILVKSLTLELLKLLSCHGFSSSLPTELKELSSKFNKLSGEVKDIKKHVQGLEIELPGELKEIPNKLETFTSIVSRQLSSNQAKLKTLDTLTSLLNKVTDALNKFAQAVENTRDQSVPLAGLVGTQPAEGEKKTKQAIISYPPKSSSQPEGEPIKKDKGKKAMSYKDVEEKSTKSDYDTNTINLAGFMVESSKKKKMKKFDFVTKGGKHVHLTKEQIKEQKRIEESVKADTTKQEVEASKEE
ncbi:hypothetical protein Tco_0603230 [Tanacetum coccineum]